MANIDDAFSIQTLSLGDNVLITSGGINPPSDGYEAPIGSLYFSDTTGNLYHKFGTTDYDWNEFGEVDAAAVFAALKSPTGFIDRTSSIFAFNTSSQVFTIQPAAPANSFTYYIKGHSTTITTAQTLNIPNVSGLYYIYFNGQGALQYQTYFSDTIITENCIVATVYWNATAQDVIALCDERHGCNMDGQTHVYLHNTVGTRYIAGLQIGGTITPNVSTDTAVQLSISNGSIRDEDLVLSIVNTGTQANTYDLQQTLTSIAQIPVMFQLGATGEWFYKQADNFPFIYQGAVGYTGALIPINKWVSTGWQLASLAENQYGFLHILATNDIKHPIIVIHGYVAYDVIPSGKDQAYNELSTLQIEPFPEYTPIASIIFQTSRTLGDTHHIIYVPTASGAMYVDWTKENNLILNTHGVSNHSELTGLNNDDHQQYALSGAGSTRTFNIGDLYNIRDISHAYSDTQTYGLKWDFTTSAYDISTISLNALRDVNVPNSFAINGYALTWNNSTGNWQASQMQTPLRLYSENPSSPTPPAAQGMNSVAIGSGAQTELNASKSLAIGEQSTARIAGSIVHANGRFSSVGDAQVGRYLLRTNTVNGNYTEAFMDGTNGSVRLVIPDNATWVFTATITAHLTSDVGGHAGFKVEGVVYRDSGANTIGIQGNINKTVISKSDPVWDINIITDPIHGSLKLTVKGDTSQIVRWVGLIETVEITN